MRQDLSAESDNLLILTVLQAMDKETISHKLKNLYKYWEIIICAYRSDVGLHSCIIHYIHFLVMYFNLENF